MSLERGCELGVLIQQVVLPDAALFLWVTSAYLDRWHMLFVAQVRTIAFAGVDQCRQGVEDVATRCTPRHHRTIAF